jgi:hypothetical protein
MQYPFFCWDAFKVKVGRIIDPFELIPFQFVR